MTVEISRGHNPLRDPEDARLNRIAGPSALVIFGVTGDLAKKKLLPAMRVSHAVTTPWSTCASLQLWWPAGSMGGTTGC